MRSCFKNAVYNTLSGFFISLILQYLCLKFLSINDIKLKSIIITIIFTIVSVIRNYIFSIMLIRKNKTIF